MAGWDNQTLSSILEGMEIFNEVALIAGLLLLIFNNLRIIINPKYLRREIA